MPLVRAGAVRNVRVLLAAPNGALVPSPPPAEKLTVAPGLRTRPALIRVLLPTPLPDVDVKVECPLPRVRVPNFSNEAAAKVLLPRKVKAPPLRVRLASSP